MLKNINIFPDIATNSSTRLVSELTASPFDRFAPDCRARSGYMTGSVGGRLGTPAGRMEAAAC